MNSLLIWVLTISPYSAYCLSTVKIEYKTEQECMTALHNVRNPKLFDIQCNPMKKPLTKDMKSV